MVYTNQFYLEQAYCAKLTMCPFNSRNARLPSSRAPICTLGRYVKCSGSFTQRGGVLTASRWSRVGCCCIRPKYRAAASTGGPIGTNAWKRPGPASRESIRLSCSALGWAEAWARRCTLWSLGRRVKLEISRVLRYSTYTVVRWSKLLLILLRFGDTVSHFVFSSMYCLVCIYYIYIYFSYIGNETAKNAYDGSEGLLCSLYRFERL